MNELEQVVRAWEQATGPCLLASVVKTIGSTYRRPGARLLGDEAGWRAGGVSGGCLERDILGRGWWRTADGPTVVVYDSTTDEDDPAGGYGLGCQGQISVLLERVAPGADTGPLPFLRRCLQRRHKGVMATVIDGAAVGERVLVAPDGVAATTVRDPALAAAVESDARAVLAAGASCHRSYRQGEVFFEVVAPPRSLTVFGGGFDVPPLVELARLVGWRVTVVDGRPPRRRFPLADQVVTAPAASLPADLELGPDAAAVIMTHSYEQDRALLRVLLASPVGYLGLLGPRARTDRLLDELGAPPRDRARLHAPVGIDIGAEGPHQIALAILAELQATFAPSHHAADRVVKQSPALGASAAGSETTHAW